MAERFTLLTELGRGGMGVVWKARDEETGQIVALKLLREVYADDPDYLTRFERELELAKRIHSPNVVQVLGYGVRDGTPYLALEYVDGPSLRERLASHGPYQWPEAKALLAQIAQGLIDAHEAGVIHRDLKPSNVLIGSDGVAKLADFGIAKGLDLTRVTGTSTMLGTPAYLAPEGPSDERSDLYSLGVIAYEILAGAVPFEGHTYQDVILRHVRDAPDFAKLPRDARQIVSRLLAKSPAKRPQRARELVSLLAPGVGATAIPSSPEVEPVAPSAPAAPPATPLVRPHSISCRTSIAAAFALSAAVVILGSALLASGFRSAGRVTATASASGKRIAATTPGASIAATQSPTPTPRITAQPGSKPWLAWKPSGSGKAVEVDLPAPWTGGSKSEIDVYTPPGYNPDEDRAYPVIYEAPTGLSLWDKGTGVLTALDTLIDSGEIPATIVVFIDSLGPPYGDTECADSFDGKQWFETYISKTVVEFVDTHFRTIQDPAARAIMGMSAGGFCAPMLTLRHPDVFRTSISFSGYFWVGAAGAESAVPFGSAGLNSHSPTWLAQNLQGNLRSQMYFIIVAADNGDFYGVSAKNFEDTLRTNGYKYYALASQYTHGWPQVRYDTPAVLDAWAAQLVINGIW